VVQVAIADKVFFLFKPPFFKEKPQKNQHLWGSWVEGFFIFPIAWRPDKDEFGRDELQNLFIFLGKKTNPLPKKTYQKKQELHSTHVYWDPIRIWVGWRPSSFFNLFELLSFLSLHAFCIGFLSFKKHVSFFLFKKPRVLVFSLTPQNVHYASPSGSAMQPRTFSTLGQSTPFDPRVVKGSEMKVKHKNWNLCRVFLAQWEAPASDARDSPKNLEPQMSGAIAKSFTDNKILIFSEISQIPE